MMQLSLVPHGVIHTALPQVIPYLKVSEEWTRGRSNVDDILNFILSGRMQLWVVFDPEDSAVHGYVMTEIKQYPQKKMFIIQYCAMDPNHMQYVADAMHDKADAFAKNFGCAGIEFHGRPGWEPHVKKRGYVVKTTVYEKHFDEVKS